MVFDGQKLDLKDNERTKREKARTARDQKLQNLLNREEFPEGILVIENVGTNQSMDEIKHISAHPGKADYAFIRNFLHGEDVRTAKYEAEALCCYMVHTNQAYAVLTSDTDVFAYLCPRVIQGAHMTLNDAKVIEMEKVLQDLQLTETEFQQLCVYCGNDFIENLASIGPATALKAVRSKNTLGPPEYEEKAKIILHLFETCCYENE